MSLDHYVSQVHLKKFYSPELENLMYAIQKSDLKAYTPDAQSVCRIEEGSTNSYLREERAVEEFLKGIEPKYYAILAKISAGKIDDECVCVIAGFVAYVITCSPAGMRIQSELLKGKVEKTAKILESKGALPVPPPELGKDTLTKLLDSGKLLVEIDPKYPQAIGIDSIRSLTNTFVNSKWDFLMNPFDDSPFFTSDFPVAIEKTGDPRFFNRITPLSPNLAIRIRPDLSSAVEPRESSFSGFRTIIRKISRQEVVSINRLIVRCAEKTVFFRDNHEWVPEFVRENADFRIEPRITKIPYENRKPLLPTLEIIKTRSGAMPSNQVK